MSISAALSNALSGLNAASRMASVTSDNVANALTEGYARRTLATSPRGLEGGVRVDGIVRHADPALIAERRGVSSDLSNADTFATYRGRIESLFGTPEDSHALTSLYARFETALVSAASRPDLPERLNILLSSAEDITDGFARLQDGIQGIRSEADAEIDAAVTKLNARLAQVAELNTAIADARLGGGDTSPLLDLRQQQVDAIAEMMPVRTVSRGPDAIAVFTEGGAILVDGGASAEVAFTRTNTITPHQTLDNGFLSGLTINGVAIDPGADGPLAGGRLAALFQIRDDFSVTAQSQIDAAARDLVERYQDAGLDSTRAPGDPGLFTDAGLAFVAADEVGLAGRLAINGQVDPDQGGATWRLRAGLGAATAGAVGDSTLLHDMIDALTAIRTPATGDFGTGGLTGAGIGSTILSQIGSARYIAEDRLAFASARHGEVEARYLAGGVDTDQEMQRLLQIEQHYAANARMVQTIDEMMNTLLRI